MEIEGFNEFLMKACDVEDWNHDVFPSVWGLFKHDSRGPQWEKAVEGADPYDLIAAFVAIGMHEDFESMLVMYGSMVKIDENDENDEETRTRVRVLIHMDGETPRVAVQPQGEMVFFPDGAGEGLMPETLNDMIQAYKNGEFAHD